MTEIISDPVEASNPLTSADEVPSSNLRCVIGSDTINAINLSKLHQAFREWLLVTPVATSFQGQLDDIRLLFESNAFCYNKFDLLEPEVTIDFLDNKTVKITNGLRFDLEHNSGYCSELAWKALRLIRAKYPSLMCLLEEGGSPGFERHGYNHFFVAAFDGFAQTADGKRVEVNGDFDRERYGKLYYYHHDGSHVCIIDDLWIIDPTHCRVVLGKDSGYKCTSYRYDHAFEYGQQDIIAERQESYAVPIAYGEKTKYFLDLLLCPSDKSLRLRLNIEESPIILDFDSPAWEEHLREDANLLEFWRSFAQKYRGKFSKSVV